MVGWLVGCCWLVGWLLAPVVVCSHPALARGLRRRGDGAAAPASAAAAFLARGDAGDADLAASAEGERLARFARGDTGSGEGSASPSWAAATVLWRIVVVVCVVAAAAAAAGPDGRAAISTLPSQQRVDDARAGALMAMANATVLRPLIRGAGDVAIWRALFFWRRSQKRGTVGQ